MDEIDRDCLLRYVEVGDDLALTFLVWCHMPLVRSVALRVLDDRVRADFVGQQVFLELARDPSEALEAHRNKDFTRRRCGWCSLPRVRTGPFL